MRSILLAFCLTMVCPCLTHPLLAQRGRDASASLGQLCKATVIDKSAEPAIVTRIRGRLAPKTPKSEHIRLVVVESDVVNAFTHTISLDEAVICLPMGMIALLADSEDELAFMVGHEVGHTLDKMCKSPQGRQAISHSANPTTQQRYCEKRADEIGFTLMRRAGYSPFAAAGAFGRLEMVNGRTRTGLLARLTAGDHPITPDRIDNLRRLLLEDASTTALTP